MRLAPLPPAAPPSGAPWRWLVLPPPGPPTSKAPWMRLLSGGWSRCRCCSGCCSRRPCAAGAAAAVAWAAAAARAHACALQVPAVSPYRVGAGAALVCAPLIPGWARRAHRRRLRSPPIPAGPRRVGPGAVPACALRLLVWAQRARRVRSPPTQATVRAGSARACVLAGSGPAGSPWLLRWALGARQLAIPAVRFPSTPMGPHTCAPDTWVCTLMLPQPRQSPPSRRPLRRRPGRSPVLAASTTPVTLATVMLAPPPWLPSLASCVAMLRLFLIALAERPPRWSWAYPLGGLPWWLRSLSVVMRLPSRGRACPSMALRPTLQEPILAVAVLLGRSVGH